MLRSRARASAGRLARTPMHHHPALRLPLLLLMLLALAAAGCSGGDGGSRRGHGEAAERHLRQGEARQERQARAGRRRRRHRRRRRPAVAASHRPQRALPERRGQDAAEVRVRPRAEDGRRQRHDRRDLDRRQELAEDRRARIHAARRRLRGLTARAARTTPAPVDLSTFGVDPRNWLSDVENLGEEDLRGDRVIHLRADVDSEPLVADLDKLLGRAGGVGRERRAGRISEAQRQELIDAITGADVDIWTGAKDHKLRRILVDVKLDTPSRRPARSSSTWRSRRSTASRRSGRRPTRGRSPS